MSKEVKELQAKVDTLEAKLNKVVLMVSSNSYEQDSPDVLYLGKKEGASGKFGSGGGSSLEMAGWIWDFEPRPDDKTPESGRIVFEIKVDERGKIISVKTLERSVSNTVALLYEKEVERLTFSKTSTISSVPSTTTGKITFIIKAK